MRKIRMADAGPTSNPKKRSFDSAFKLKVVEFAEKNSNRGAGRKFGVDEKRVREWRKQKPQLESLPRKKKRMDGGGRKADCILYLPYMVYRYLRTRDAC